MQSQAKDFSDSNKHLWTDFPDAKERMTAVPRASSQATLSHFIDQGYTVLPQAVTHQAVDTLLADIAQILVDADSKVYVEYWGTQGKRRDIVRAEMLSKPEAKVLDLHTHLPSTHQLIFSPALLAFMRDVFQDEPVAFQSLYFEYGSQQPAHNDTAFVLVDPAAKMVASWIALEDIVPNSGELFFYPRSQRVAEQVFASGGKAFDGSDPDAKAYSPWLEQFARDFQLSRTLFRPRKADALFWAADLIHGGEKTTSQSTRRSLVTHYCPLHAAVPYARAQGKAPTALQGGGYVVSQS